MLPSLQTHFNAPVDRATLDTIRGFGFRWCRMDAQTCDAWTLQQLIADAEAADLVPLPIVYDLDRLRAVPPGHDVEWGNEPDGDIWPESYRARLDDACALALELGVRLWAPAISNLDYDSLFWLELVRAGGWPAGLYGLTAHRYGNGTFEWPHDGFASRDAEVDAFLARCDGRPWMITEFGYPTKPTRAAERRGAKRTRYLQPDLHLSEAEQAANIAQEWAFWARRGCAVPFLYQINDGTEADEGYGIRYCAPDGTSLDWKQAAYEVPKEDAMSYEKANVAADALFLREDLVPLDGRPDEYSLRFPIGAETILSPKIDGQHELRPMSSKGNADETCKIIGGCVVFVNVNGQRLAWRLADA